MRGCVISPRSVRSMWKSTRRRIVAVALALHANHLCLSEFRLTLTPIARSNRMVALRRIALATRGQCAYICYRRARRQSSNQPRTGPAVSSSRRYTRTIPALIRVLTALWSRRAVQHAQPNRNWQTKRAADWTRFPFGHDNPEERELVELAGRRCDGCGAGRCAMMLKTRK